MSAMQAAMGVVQLERVEELVGRKRELFGWYRDRLGAVAGLVLNAEPPRVHNSYWMSTVVLDESFALTKDVVVSELRAAGVAARPFFHPLSALPAHAGFADTADAEQRRPVSYRLGRYGVNLPSALQLTRADVDRVCDALLEVLERSQDR